MQLKFSKFLQRQIPIMVLLSLLPGLGYIFLGWLAGVFQPALVWYLFNLGISLWGIQLYRRFDEANMGRAELESWNRWVIAFCYTFFALWALIFILYSRETASGLDRIAIFTQIGATTVAASFLYPEPRLFRPIIPLMILVLVVYFLGIGEWYGYVLSIFSAILGGVLYHASNSSYHLLRATDRQASHDLLTDLHNRHFFIEKLHQLMIDLRRRGAHSFLLLIDLDHFKTVNDSLGHDVGDRLLQEVALRMRQKLPTHCSLARLGGDEFIVIGGLYASREQSRKRAWQLAEELLDILKQTYVVMGHHVYISASIGVRTFSSEDGDSTNLVREADIAMYEAKAAGRDAIFLFTEEMSARVEQHLQVERLLHFALQKQELYLQYQPMVDAKGRIVGAECLVRWNNDSLGEVPPGKFIPIAEQTGLIVDLGRYILEQSFQTLRAWSEKEMDLEQFSINISVRQMMNSRFAEEVQLLCETYLTPALTAKLVFEVTESVISEEVTQVIDTMKALQELGIGFSMDDFGTGYSSLSYLKQLPVGELKIDRSFVRHIDQNDENLAMVRTILNIARFMGLTVVAEGIENEAEFDVLRQLDCKRFQGYYFGRPLSSKAFLQQYAASGAGGIDQS